VILPAILEKVAYGVALIILGLQHRVPQIVIILGSVDWLFAILFAMSYITSHTGEKRA
jgi:hypothetical protein